MGSMSTSSWATRGPSCLLVQRSCGAGAPTLRPRRAAARPAAVACCARALRRSCGWPSPAPDPSAPLPAPPVPASPTAGSPAPPLAAHQQQHSERATHHCAAPTENETPTEARAGPHPDREHPQKQPAYVGQAGPVAPMQCPAQPAPAPGPSAQKTPPSQQRRQAGHTPAASLEERSGAQHQPRQSPLPPDAPQET